MASDLDLVPLTEMVKAISEINGGLTYSYNLLSARARRDDLPGVLRFMGRYYFRRSRLLETIAFLRETRARPAKPLVRETVDA